MSQIDLNQPIFEDDYASSQQASQPPNRQSLYSNFESEADSHFQPAPHINLFRNAPSSRISETTITKRSSPLKLKPCILKSQQNPSQHYHSWYRQQQTKPNSSFLTNISESETFECQHKLYMNSQCPICKGTGFLKGSHNMVKFFSYVIGFKFGVNSSYRSENQINSQKKSIKRKKTQVNSFCSDFFNNQTQDGKDLRSTNIGGFKINSRSSLSQANMTSSVTLEQPAKGRESYINAGRMSYKSSKKCCKQELMDEINSTLVIHEDYVCDICSSQPIIGPRFHCNDCQDYDLCQPCYEQNPHEHIMQKVEKSGKSKQLQNIVTLLVQPIPTNNGRISLRPPPAIEPDRLTTKSAIR